MANAGMLTPAQIRAARALLNWSQAQLAEASEVASQSIKNIERGVTDPRLSTAMAIKTSLEKAGVQFLEPSDSATGPGVALKTAGQTQCR
jgi:DNA-binding XRE family transcriptional regulator